MNRKGFKILIDENGNSEGNIVTPPTTTTIGLEALPRYKTIIKQRQ
jgi:hypothetical protein